MTTQTTTTEITNVSVAIEKVMNTIRMIKKDLTELETEMIEHELKTIAYAQTVDCKNKMNEILNQIYR